MLNAGVVPVRALGRAPRGPAVLRSVIGGAIAMDVTYAVGTLIGAAGI